MLHPFRSQFFPTSQTPAYHPKVSKGLKAEVKKEGYDLGLEYSC